MITNNNGRIVKNTIFLYIRMVVVLLISLYSTRVLLSALGVVDYGIYNVVCGFVTLFSFMNATMSSSVQRFFNYEMGENGEKNIGNVYVTSLLIQFSIVVLILIFIETFGLWYVNHKMVIPEERLSDANWVFQFTTASLVLVVIQVPYSAAIMANEKMDYYALVNIIDAVLKLMAVLFVKYAVDDNKLVVYGLCIMGISVFNFLMYFLYSKEKFSYLKFSFAIDKKMLKSMFSFIGWRTIECLAFMLKGQGLNMVLNFYFGPVINAANAVAMQVTNAVEGFRTNLFTAFNPQLVKSYADGNVTRTRQLMYGMSKIAFVLVFMISMPLVIELNYVLGLWLGNDVPEYTAMFTVFLIVNMLITVFNVPLTTAVGATGRIRKYSILQTVNILTIIPFALLFMNIVRLPQVVYCVSVSVVFINQIMMTFVAGKEIPFQINNYLSSVILPCLTIMVLSPIIPVLISHYMDASFMRLVVICATSVAIVIPLSFFIVLDKNEKNMVKRFLINKFKVFNK